MNMEKRILALVFALTAVSMAALAADSGLRRAHELFRRTDYDRARRAAAEDTSAMDPSSLADALLFIARTETDYAKADRLLRRVIASRNERAAGRASLELATIRYATGDYAGALDLLAGGRPEGTDREAEKARYFAGLCLRQLGDTARAAAQFASITRGEYSPWSMLARAEIDARAGRFSEAIDGYERVARSQRSPIAAFELAECLEQLGERDKALERYRSLITEFPQSFEAVKANEKIQRARARDETQPGGGESGASPAGGGTSTAAVRSRYTIQFGAFATQANALAVSEKLGTMFRAVRVERFEHEGRVMHRVRVGIYESSEAAATDVARAKERLGLNGAIVPLP
jgi:tetratricopeptide (TPR) repeat protein